MKAIVSLLIFASHLCMAAGDANIIVVSEWSEPVFLVNDHLHDEAIRGRLLIIQGMEPAYGGPPTTNGAMTFVELQNVTGACCGDIDFFFAVTNLHCELSDATGKTLPMPAGVNWGGRGPLVPSRVNLPYNSRVRLFVNAGSIDPLMVFPSGEPWCYWSIVRSGTNTYFLAGNLSLSTLTNSTHSPDHYKAILVFPKTRLTTGQVEHSKR